MMPLTPFIQLVLLLVLPCAASNSTALQGWQSDDNSRSTWDIVWSCLSTILACTWTVLHLQVPPRNQPRGVINAQKARGWFYAILAPEIVAFEAGRDMFRAMAVKKLCNSVQAARDRRVEEPDLGLSKRTQPLDRVEDLDLHPVHSEWTLAQSFCITMSGLAVVTQDDWIYVVKPEDMSVFIDAGLIRCSDFRDRDIQDRAKADSFAKFVTVIQSAWLTCNILARSAYGLPISPIELCTVAYVACGVVTYLFWWHKPKDMTTVITINIPYQRENMPPEIQEVVARNPSGWVHCRAIQSEQGIVSVVSSVAQAPLVTPETPEGLSANSNVIIDVFGGVGALSFCAIHVAGWNFVFPTEAERIAWRVFSLASLAFILAFAITGTIGDVSTWLASKHKAGSLKIQVTGERTIWLRVETFLLHVFLVAYFTTRFGIMALVFSSLRALPAGSYTTIDWLASIPHI